MKTQPINPADYYCTSDLTTAVTLAIFFPLELIDKTNPRKALFVFRRTDDLEKKLQQYWHRSLLVEPQEFSNQLKSLKTRLYYE